MSTKFARGARPTPRHLLCGATPHEVIGATPPEFALIPKQLSMWLNDTDGDCVTAEEAFKVAATVKPEVMIRDATVKAWASDRGVLNGADLLQVLQLMQRYGFQQDGHMYNDGRVTSIDYSNEAILQNAISKGPVKIGIDANALPSTAGNANGWFSFGGSPGQFNNEDHCVSLCGYGPTSWLFAQLGVALPADAPAAGYLLFTWSTIGVVDHAWIMSTCGEAWLRTPQTIVQPKPA